MDLLPYSFFRQKTLLELAVFEATDRRFLAKEEPVNSKLLYKLEYNRDYCTGSHVVNPVKPVIWIQVWVETTKVMTYDWYYCHEIGEEIETEIGLIDHYEYYFKINDVDSYDYYKKSLIDNLDRWLKLHTEFKETEKQYKDSKHFRWMDKGKLVKINEFTDSALKK